MFQVRVFDNSGIEHPSTESRNLPNGTIITANRYECIIIGEGNVYKVTCEYDDLTEVLSWIIPNLSVKVEILDKDIEKDIFER